MCIAICMYVRTMDHILRRKFDQGLSYVQRTEHITACMLQRQETLQHDGTTADV